MTERLVRALERGGCLSKVNKRWDVWRSTDLRSRMIGALGPGMMVALSSLGLVHRLANRPAVWVWCGLDGSTQSNAPPTSQPSTCAAATDPETCLNRLLALHKTDVPRSAMEAAIKRFQNDVTEAEILWSRRLSERDTVEPACDWTGRLRNIRSAMPPGDWELLLNLCICKRTLVFFERHLDQIEADAIDRLLLALKGLAEVYGIRPVPES